MTVLVIMYLAFKSKKNWHLSIRLVILGFYHFIIAIFGITRTVLTMISMRDEDLFRHRGQGYQEYDDGI